MDEPGGGRFAAPPAIDRLLHPGRDLKHPGASWRILSAVHRVRAYVDVYRPSIFTAQAHLQDMGPRSITNCLTVSLVCDCRNDLAQTHGQRVDWIAQREKAWLDGQQFVAVR